VDSQNLLIMQQGWVRLMERCRVEPAAAQPAFELLAAAYNSADRHYHTFEHLEEMFRIAGRLTAITDDPRALQLAIWFHDAVYDPRAKDNEARSAELAVALLGPIGVPRSALDVAIRLIEATAHLASPKPPGDRETAILLDADLAILGSAPERYRRYAADIRKEYGWVPAAEYRSARSNVLHQFLARPRLFWTDVMYAECEARARQNMEGEVRGLR
jgi:predicted metal-dependent HD superfamily phosphohydrolase